MRGSPEDVFQRISQKTETISVERLLRAGELFTFKGRAEDCADSEPRLERLGKLLTSNGEELDLIDFLWLYGKFGLDNRLG